MTMKKLFISPLFWLCILSIVFFASRLVNLTALPIFTDEAIYIRWAQIGGRDASWRFISLTDGKQPLFTWAVMATLRFFDDPLFAGRFVSVCAGWLTMIGMYMTGVTLSGRKIVGIFASFLYVISPFALFYDRLAMYDSLVATFFVWNLYMTVLLVRNSRLDIALLLGLGLGVGILNKTSAFLSLYLLPVSLILFDWGKKKRMVRLGKWIGYVLISIIFSQVVYSILRLSAYFYIVAQKDAIFVYPFAQWITHPLEFFVGNIRGMSDWLIAYMTWPVFLSAATSLLIFRKDMREKVLLVCWWLIPFVGLACFGRILYPRFILFMVMPLLILAAYWFLYIYDFFKKSLWSIVCIVLISGMSIINASSIIWDIKTARIPYAEKGQYIQDWPSGWGVPEIVAFVKKEAQKGTVSLFTEGTFGLLPYAFEIFLEDVPTVDIHGIWPIPTEMPQKMVESAFDHPTFFVMYQNQKPPFEWQLKLLATYAKGLNPDSTMRLYQVVVQGEGK